MPDGKPTAENTRRLAIGFGLAGLALMGVLHYVNDDGYDASPVHALAPAPAAPSTAETVAHDPAACVQCQLANSVGHDRKCNHTSSTANELTTDPAKFGCDGFDAGEARLCRELLDCLRGPACAADIEHAVAQQSKWGATSGYNVNDLRDDPTPCFCGRVPKIDFDTGRPVDPSHPGAGNVMQPGCVSIEATQLTGACAAQYRAFKGVNVHTAFYSTDSGIGVANNLFSCERDVPCPACLR